jgi:hypothetical protein
MKWQLHASFCSDEGKTATVDAPLEGEGCIPLHMRGGTVGDPFSTVNPVSLCIA